jgi:hypothetical protein
MRRLRRGRLSVYIEPRDVWIGIYVAPGAIYICLLPCLVIRWSYHDRVIRWPHNDQIKADRGR